MRFKLEIDNREILEFVQETASRAINMASLKIGDPVTTTVDGKSESNETAYSNVVSAFINAAVTMKIRALELKLSTKKPRTYAEGFVDRLMEGDDVSGDGPA